MRAAILLFFLFPVTTLAAQFVTQPTSFDIDTWTNAGAPATYYGELESFPHTFDFLVSEPQVFDFSLWLRRENMPVSFILVQVMDRGVEEVLRYSAIPGELERVRDRSLGMTFTASEVRSVPLESGLYRFEVSSPDNLSKYRLEVNGGSEVSGYGASLSEAFSVYGFYSNSLFVVFSPLVYWPLLVVGLIIYWRRKRQRNHA